MWDGSHRCLYADGVEIAKDTAVLWAIPSDGGLHFGAGKTIDAAGFWSGLIDNVRIYNRVVTP